MGIDRFSELMKQRKVTIPLIQRDYAQGREEENVTIIREDLIKDVFQSLLNHEKLDLNFIYGIENQNDEEFLPIDGQQRLTSLYLICWFCAVAEGKIDEFRSNVKAFDYQIRRSSTAFFTTLREFDNHKEDFENYVNKKAEMENFGWYKPLWSYDPTVSGAVTFLNKVRELYWKTFQKQAADKSVSFTESFLSPNCPLQFVYFCQNQKSDELFAAENRAALTYINMNARGKELNDFENLKALICSHPAPAAKKFVQNYESTYINIFLNLVEKNKNPKTLEAKIKHMDEITQGLLLCLYNDLQMLQDPKTATQNSIYDLMSSIREKKPFPKYYFELIDFVMEQCNNNDNLQTIVYDYCTEKLTYHSKYDFFHAFWYDFRIEFKPCAMDWDTLCRHMGVVASEGETLANHNYLKCQYRFVETIAEGAAQNKKLENLLEFLASMDPAVIVNQEEIKSVISLATLMEEKIKAGICVEDQTRYDFLEQTGKRHGYKIRYLLYISGYWSGTGNWWNAFEMYAKADERWNAFEMYAKADEQCSPQNANMMWKKAYYIQSLNSQGGSYQLASKGAQTYWHTEVLLWNKNAPEDEKIKELKKVKALYDTLYKGNPIDLQDYLNDIKKNLKHSDWLYYVLDRDYDSLLYNKVSKDSNGMYLYNERNFFDYVLRLDFERKGYKAINHCCVNLRKSLPEIRVDPVNSASKTSRNMLVIVSYQYAFDLSNKKEWQLHLNNKKFHLCSFAGIQQDEDAFEWEIDSSTFGAQSNIIQKLCTEIGKSLNNSTNFNETDLEDIVIYGDFKKLQSELQGILNTFNTQNNCNISLQSCEKYGTREIHIFFANQNKIPFNPSQSNSSALHSAIYSQL